jgi:hypothetical protein
MEKETLYGIKGTRNAFVAAWLAARPELQKVYGKNPNTAFTQFTPELEAAYQEFLKENTDLQSHKPTAEELAEYIEDYFNSFSSKEKALIEQLERKHRTLQQSFSKFVFKWIEHMATDEYRVDGRNEGSQMVAKRLMAGFKNWLRDNDPNSYSLLPSDWIRMI